MIKGTVVVCRSAEYPSLLAGSSTVPPTLLVRSGDLQIGEDCLGGF